MNSDVLSAVAKGQSYGQVARRFGLTRGAVSGIVYRSRNPYVPIPPEHWKKPEGREAPTQMKVLEALADGRLRTAQDVASASGLRWQQAYSALRVLARSGVIRKVAMGGQYVAWIEVDE